MIQILPNARFLTYSFRWGFSLVASLFLLSACGYILEGSNPVLPKGAKSIAILPIQNQSFQSGMETRLMRELQKLFRNNASVTLQNSVKKADLVLEITLKQLTRERSILENNTPNTNTEIVFTLQGEVTLRNNRSHRTLWKASNFQAQATTSNDDISALSGLLITRGFREVTQVFSKKIYDRIFLNF